MRRRRRREGKKTNGVSLGDEINELFDVDFDFRLNIETENGINSKSDFSDYVD